MLGDNKGNGLPMAVALIQVKAIQGKISSKYLKGLFDSGSSTSLDHTRILPQVTHAEKLQTRAVINTAAGVMQPLGSINIEGMRLPEFDRNAVVNNHKFKLFNADF